MFAFLHNARGGKYQLTIARDVEMRDVVVVLQAVSKREARIVAKGADATACNF